MASKRFKRTEGAYRLQRAVAAEASLKAFKESHFVPVDQAELSKWKKRALVAEEKVDHMRALLDGTASAR